MPDMNTTHARTHSTNTVASAGTALQAAIAGQVQLRVKLETTGSNHVPYGKLS
jgi:hypothetical protein